MCIWVARKSEAKVDPLSVQSKTELFKKVTTVRVHLGDQRNPRAEGVGEVTCDILGFQYSRGSQERDNRIQAQQG